jgi:hypothetical protein
MVISMGANHPNFNPLELAFWSAMALNLMALGAWLGGAAGAGGGELHQIRASQ